MKRKKKEEKGTGLEPGAELPRRLTPLDIQEKIFRTELKGYKKQDIDVFLDQVTEELATLLEENRRLREGSAAGAELAEAHAEAEEIKRKARAEAAAISGGAGNSADAKGAISGFLASEKRFLQGLAESISGHAESVTRMAKDARATGAPRHVPATETEPARSPPAAPARTDADPEPGEPVVTVTSPPPATGKSIISIANVEETVAPAAGKEEKRPVPESAPSKEQPPESETGDRPLAFPAAPEKTEREEEKPATVPPRDRSLRELFWGEE